MLKNVLKGHSQSDCTNHLQSPFILPNLKYLTQHCVISVNTASFCTPISGHAIVSLFVSSNLQAIQVDNMPPQYDYVLIIPAHVLM